MKKVELIEPYLGMKRGTIFKTDGQTARVLIERDIAIDPTGEWIKWSSSSSSPSETTSLDSAEKAVLPKAQPRKPGKWGRGGKK